LYLTTHDDSKKNCGRRNCNYGVFAAYVVVGCDVDVAAAAGTMISCLCLFGQQTKMSWNLSNDDSLTKNFAAAICLGAVSTTKMEYLERVHDASRTPATLVAFPIEISVLKRGNNILYQIYLCVVPIPPLFLSAIFINKT